MRQKLDVRAMALLASAHLCDDLNQSFIPAILPLLVVSLHLSYASAATIVFAQAASSSVIQPLIGHLADKRAMPWLIALGIFLAGGGVAVMGVSSSYPILFVAALVSGIGVAMFHPEAARFANYVAGPKKATGMRWFVVGGNLGFAIGPVFATVVIAAYGLRGTLAAFVPVTVVAVIVLVELRRLLSFLPARRKHGSLPEFADDWPSFWKLTSFVITRSMSYLGLVTFIPLYATQSLHASHSVADLLLSTFLLSGVAGTLIGGTLSDRFSRKLVLVWSVALMAVLVLVFVRVTQALGIVIAFPLAIVLGILISASQTSYILLGQEYLPNRIGIASGVTLGIAVSLGGMFTPVLGRIGDLYGLQWSIVAIAALCAIAVACGSLLPPHPRRVPFALSRALADGKESTA
jgi:FSR family fosmidomycin resistance protein-like MFS transporter